MDCHVYTNSKYSHCKILIHHILLFPETSREHVVQDTMCFRHGVTGSLTIQITKQEQGKQPCLTCELSGFGRRDMIRHMTVDFFLEKSTLFAHTSYIQLCLNNFWQKQLAYFYKTVTGRQDTLFSFKLLI